MRRTGGTSGCATGEPEAYATAAARARAETDAAWHHLTVSTDRDDATAADREPLAAASR